MSELSRPERVWVDEDDVVAQEQMPAFLKQSHLQPTWATAASDALNDEHDDQPTRSVTATNAHKRFRNKDLEGLLSCTEPLLSCKHDRNENTVPTVISVLPLPKDQARTVTWHRSGQLAVVGGNQHIYAFHAAGTYVEQLAKVDVGKRIEKAVLTASGDDVLVVNHECYVPKLLSLYTEKVLELAFLDTRDTAVYRSGRRDNTKKELFITSVAVREDDGLHKMVAVASGRTVTLGTLVSGSVVGHIQVNDPVADVKFTSPNEVTIASGNKLIIYDVRKSARYLREIVDEGALAVTSFAVSAHSLAIGSSSGMVNVYDRSNPKKPLKTLKNLTTSIHQVCFGENSSGTNVLAFSSKGQKAALRLARFPDCHVVPSFPAVSVRHDFVQSMMIAPTVPILSVGERQKVTNYAL